MKVTILLLLILAPSVLFANPPNAFHTSYDKVRAKLHVTVEHIVTDPEDHYIEKVTLYKNGREVETRTFHFQTSKRNQTMPPVNVYASPTDRLRILATCNQAGMGEKIFKIE